MARGGARANSGPPPDPNALRRDRPSDQAGWTMLPASGREGDPPTWPLQPDITMRAQLLVAERERDELHDELDSGNAKRGAEAKLERLGEKIATLELMIEATEQAERELWSELWCTPQAAQWEKLKWTREVALYVRLQVAAELGDMDAGKEARQWSDRLGLNPTALLRNRWKIDGTPTSPASAAPAPTKRSRAKKDQSAKERAVGLVVLPGGKDGGSS